MGPYELVVCTKTLYLCHLGMISKILLAPDVCVEAAPRHRLLIGLVCGAYVTRDGLCICS